jgi:hypothetical protein
MGEAGYVVAGMEEDGWVGGWAVVVKEAAGWAVVGKAVVDWVVAGKEEEVCVVAASVVEGWEEESVAVVVGCEMFLQQAWFHGLASVIRQGKANF